MGSDTSKRTTRRRGRARELQPDIAAKQLRCMDYAIAGLTFAEIAELEGYADHAGARQAVARGLERSFDSRAEELRPVYQARANTMWRHGMALFDRGRDIREDKDGNPVGPDLEMVKVGAQIADRALGRLMRLSGLDQPSTVVVAGGTDLASLKAEFMQQYLPALGVAAGQVPVDAEVVEVEG